MAHFAPPPLDPKIAELLRATEFEAPPEGAKRRVRVQLELAGIVGMATHGGAGSTVTLPSSQPVPRPTLGVDHGAVRMAHGSATQLAGKSAVSLLAAAALGAAGALLSARDVSRHVPTAQHDLPASRASEIPFGVPHQEGTAEIIDGGHRRDDHGPAAATPSMIAPRAAPSSVKKPVPMDSLGNEQRLLARARAALGRGELESAAEELERHARLFPSGRLTEEREALRIVTLAQQGNMSVARERAARFRRAYPRSIQLTTVEGAVAERP